MGYVVQSHVRALVVFDATERLLARSLIRLVRLLRGRARARARSLSLTLTPTLTLTLILTLTLTLTLTLHHAARVAPPRA